MWDCKPLVTHSAVRFGNVGVMAKTDWRDLEGGWARLKWARMNRSPFETAEAAAESMGIKPGTYRAYERPPHASKHIALDHQVAGKAAKKFKVNWVWLLTGKGSPDAADMSPAQERIMQATDGASEDELERAATVIEALLKRGAA